MRKFLSAIVVCALFTPLLFSLPTKANDPIMNSIENFLQDEAYYTENSAAVKDFVDVHTKIAINEEETKTAKIKALFVRYEHTRDDFYQFRKGKIFYYNLDDGKLLDSASVIMNDELERFVKDHQKELALQITPGTQFLFSFLVFLSILVIPFFVILLNRKNPSGNTY